MTIFVVELNSQLHQNCQKGLTVLNCDVERKVKTVARTFIEQGSCCVWISLRDDGKLLISGQDLGGVAGTSEYEYFITVEPQDFGTIREALDGAADADIVELMCAHAPMIFSAGELTWLEGLGINADFHGIYELPEDR